jgi:hypothetical protein
MAIIRKFPMILLRVEEAAGPDNRFPKSGVIIRMRNAAPSRRSGSALSSRASPNSSASRGTERMLERRGKGKRKKDAAYAST